MHSLSWGLNEKENVISSHVAVMTQDAASVANLFREGGKVILAWGAEKNEGPWK